MNGHGAIRVLIVDDSPFVCKVLLRIFESDPDIEVAGVARNGKEGIDMTLSLKPDVVTLDIMMPVKDGLETLKAIMEDYPVPVLILSQFSRDGAELTLKALHSGAMDFVDKSSRGLMDLLGLASEIIAKVKTIHHKKPKRLSCDSSLLPEDHTHGLVDAVAIGASTGGPPALQAILQRFPKNIAFGVLVVQHMPKGFTAALANRLDNLCSIHVKEAEDRDRIEPGIALIAPSGAHMRAGKIISHKAAVEGQDTERRKGLIRLSEEPLNALHRPSADILLQSVAAVYGSRAMGVILTGMGSDGVEGLKAIKEKGGLTLAQDEETSVIFGMPGAAIRNGAVDKVVPLSDMAAEIMKHA